jgi:hypothetical protein
LEKLGADVDPGPSEAVFDVLSVLLSTADLSRSVVTEYINHLFITAEIS